MSIREFCNRNGIGPTKTYSEIKKRRLIAHKVGNRTIILPESERAWRNSLPVLVPAAA
jgi:hypothetical protein